MKERPILFSTPMVRAILEGRKSQTRRIMRIQPSNHDHKGYIEAEWKDYPPMYVNTDYLPLEYFCRLCGDGITPSGHSIYKCPYGKPDDILYVKETYTIFEPEHCEGMSERFYYKADHHPLNEEWRQEMISHGYPYKWKSGRFMPKYACRLKLKVTNIRVERVQGISYEDAVLEGIESSNEFQSNEGYLHQYKDYIVDDFALDAVDSYHTLWESINGKYSWQSNPWVWVIEFERIK